MKNFIFFCLLLMYQTALLTAQNVGINATGVAPHSSAMLDILSTDKGLLIPRLPLTNITVAAPVTTPTISLMVYNTSTSALATASNNVLPGFYYWDGAKWVAFAGAGGKDWALLGNGGTVAGTNFLGTTDDIDLVFKVNNIQAGRISSSTSSPNHSSYFGYEAGLAHTASLNSYFGSQAGKASIAGANVGFGYGAMRASTTGTANTYVGLNSGANWVSAHGNTGIGWSSLQGLPGGTGSYNTALGYAAGSGFIGTANGLSQLSGSYNTFIGYSSSGTNSSNTFTNSTAIGAFSQAGANNVLILGSINGANTASATTNVGIGITTPTTALHVVETATLQGVQIDESDKGNALLINENDAGSAIVVTENGAGIGLAVTSNDDGSGFSVTQQGVVTVSNTAAYIENKSSTSTNSLLRKGLEVISNSSWAVGTATNVGIAVDVNGAGSASNYAATFIGGKVGIGTATPTESLEVQGSVKIVDGTQGLNKVLTSDAAGKGAWADIYGANIQYVENTSDITLNTATWTDMTGMSITFTPKHSTVYIYMTASGDIDVGTTPKAMGYVKCRVINSVTSVIYGKSVSIATDYDDVGVLNNGAWNCAIVCRATGLTVGASTTLKVQWSRGGVVLGTARCRPSTDDYSQRTLMIMD